MSEATLTDWPEVPAGKIRLAEYGSGVPMAPRAVLTQSVGSNGREYVLTEIGRGFEIAGSMLRFTERKYLVACWIDNAIHGRSFRSEQDAREWFARVTS